MIKFTILDMKRQKDVFSIPEPREVLPIRYDNEIIYFAISPFHLFDKMFHILLSALSCAPHNKTPAAVRVEMFVTAGVE
jgi:hypothetical protein